MGFWEDYNKRLEAMGTFQIPTIPLTEAYGVYWNVWVSTLRHKLFQTRISDGKKLWTFADTKDEILDDGTGLISTRALIMPPDNGGVGLFTRLGKMASTVNVQSQITLDLLNDKGNEWFADQDQLDEWTDTLRETISRTTKWLDRLEKYQDITGEYIGVNLVGVNTGDREQAPIWWDQVVDPLFFGVYPPDTTVPPAAITQVIPDIVTPLSLAYRLQALRNEMRDEPHEVLVNVDGWTPLAQTSTEFEDLLGEIDVLLRATLKQQGAMTVPSEDPDFETPGLVWAGVAAAVAGFIYVAASKGTK